MRKQTPDFIISALTNGSNNEIQDKISHRKRAKEKTAGKQKFLTATLSLLPGKAAETSVSRGSRACSGFMIAHIDMPVKHIRTF